MEKICHKKIHGYIIHNLEYTVLNTYVKQNIQRKIIKNIVIGTSTRITPIIRYMCEKYFS